MTTGECETIRRMARKAIAHLPAPVRRRTRTAVAEANARGNRHPQEAEPRRPPVHRLAGQEEATPTPGTTQTTTCIVVVAILLLRMTKATREKA